MLRALKENGQTGLLPSDAGNPLTGGNDLVYGCFVYTLVLLQVEVEPCQQVLGVRARDPGFRNFDEPQFNSNFCAPKQQSSRRLAPVLRDWSRIPGQTPSAEHLPPARPWTRGSSS